jgi:Family of unknown function (DUF5961)
LGQRLLGVGEIVMPNAETRAFRVHARHGDGHHARVMMESSFEAAAVAYLEAYAHAPEAGEEISVIVREVASGHEHCFRIDLNTGETTPCG